jgi:hypothetical protein
MNKEKNIRWQALKKALSEHAGIIIGMGLLSFIFISAGLFMFYDGIIKMQGVKLLFALLFIPAGVYLLILNIQLNTSSVLYYRDKEILRHLGINTDAKVLAMQIETIDEEQNSLTFEYEFEYQYQNYTGIDIVDVQTEAIELLAQLQYVPIRFLQDNPQQSSIRQRSFSQQIKKALLSPEDESYPK